MRWKVIFLALAVVGITSLPYLIGWAVQSENQIFGGFVIDLDDSNSYLAVMRQGMQGNWRFISLYTPEEQHGVWMYTFYTLLGHVIRWTGLSPLLIYHSARLVSGVLLLIAVHRFACVFFNRWRICWYALLLVGFSSGLGWLKELIAPTAPGGISPLDFWFLDAYTFLGILTFPHFALAWAALLGAFGSVLEYNATARSRHLLWGGGAAFLATSLHPTLSLVIGTVLAVYGLVLWLTDRSFPFRWAIGGTPLILGAGAMAGYLWFAFNADPVLKSWSQSVMPTPALHHFLPGYGLLVPLASVGAFQLRTRQDRRGLFLVVWIAVAFLLAYAPFGLQRRLLEGVHIPISLLAALGLHRLLLVMAQSRPLRRLAALGYPRRRAVWLTRSALIAVMSLSNLYLLGSASLAAWQRSSGMFHPQDQLDAFAWLEDHLTERDVVLASYDTGNLIPAWTGRRVFLGHWAESLDWMGRKHAVARFFTPTTAHSWRQELLREHRISHVFFGRYERELGDFDPSSAPYLREAYATGEVVVYGVVSELETRWRYDSDTQFSDEYRAGGDEPCWLLVLVATSELTPQLSLSGSVGVDALSYQHSRCGSNCRFVEVLDAPLLPDVGPVSRAHHSFGSIHWSYRPLAPYPPSGCSK